MPVGPGITELVIANVPEAFLPLFARYVPQERYDDLVHDEARLGDRCLFWSGQRKLVVTSYRAEHEAYAYGAGFWGTVTCISPRQPSASICHDVLREPDILERIVGLLADQPSVRLVAYVASDTLFSLVDVLKSRNVRLHLAETPARDAMRRARAFDTKTGFRRLAESWCLECPDLKLPQGKVAASTDEAAAIAVRRLGAGVACVCKADIGAAGSGCCGCGQISSTATTPSNGCSSRSLPLAMTRSRSRIGST